MQTTNAARSAPGRPRADRRHRREGARLRQLPQAAAGRDRHQRARGAGLGQHGRPLDQRPQRRLQLLLRRRHQQGHRLEQRQLRRAGARLDCRGPGPDVELPGRIRPQLGSDDHRRHPQRLEGLPRQRRLLQARRCVERQRVQPAAAVQPGGDRAVRPAAVSRSTTPPGRWAARCCCPAPRFNRERNKLFFFWSQDLLDRTDPGSLQHSAGCRPRPSAAATSPGRWMPTTIWSTSATRCCRAAAASTRRRAACFPGNVIPANRINPTTQALLNLFPLPNATDPTGRNQYNYTFQTVQEWPRNDQVAAHRLERGAEHHRSIRACSSATRSGPAASRSSARPARAGRSSRANTRSTPSASSTRCCTPSARRCISEVTVGVNWAHQYTSALDDNGRRRQRPDDRAARVPAVLPAGEPRQPAAAGLVRRRHPGHHCLVQRREPLAVLRLQHAVELLRQHHEDCRRPQCQGGVVRRAHDAAGAARRPPSTARSASTPTGRIR